MDNLEYFKLLEQAESYAEEYIEGMAEKRAFPSGEQLRWPQRGMNFFSGKDTI